MADALQDALSNSTTDIAIITTDNVGLITIFNKGAESLLGYSSDEIVGKKSIINFHDTADFDQACLLLSTRLEKKLSGFEALKAISTNDFKQEWLYRDNLRNPIKVKLSVTPINGNHGSASGFLLMVHKINPYAMIDCLTELPDHHVFEKVLDRELRRMHRDQHPLSLLSIQVDDFSACKNALGVDLSENHLKQIAHALSERVQRAGDLLTYNGDDKFSVILPNTDKPGAVKLAEQLRLCIAALEIPLTISVGIANLIPENETDNQLLIQSAEKGLQQAIKDGKNCSRFV